MKGAPGRVSKHRARYKGREKLCRAALCTAPTTSGRRARAKLPQAPGLRLSAAGRVAGWGPGAGGGLAAVVMPLHPSSSAKALCKAGGERIALIFQLPQFYV